MKPYTLIDHTADIGLRIRGHNLRQVFARAGFGLFDLITDADKIKTEKSVSFHLKAESRGDLFLVWLRELLFTFSAKKLVFKKFIFKKLTEKELHAIATGERFDPKLHEQKMEIKAITYHQFKLEKQKSGWIAEVILDI